MLIYSHCFLSDPIRDQSKHSTLTLPMPNPQGLLRMPMDHTRGFLNLRAISNPRHQTSRILCSSSVSPRTSRNIFELHFFLPSAIQLQQGSDPLNSSQNSSPISINRLYNPSKIPMPLKRNVKNGSTISKLKNYVGLAFGQDGFCAIIFSGSQCRRRESMEIPIK